MSVVFVDDAVHPWRGMLWCHVFSLDLEALHEMAGKIGLMRSWFQQPPKVSWPHYDTIAKKRSIAVKRHGAVATDKYTTLAVALHHQGRLTEAKIADITKCREMFNRPRPEGSPA